jgi:hypothetical protein
MVLVACRLSLVACRLFGSVNEREQTHIFEKRSRFNFCKNERADHQPLSWLFYLLLLVPKLGPKMRRGEK